MTTGAIKEAVFRKPDMAQVGTSHIERQILTMSMGMRRFPRLTYAFSKKAENHSMQWPCTLCTTTSAAPIRRCA